MFIFLQPPKTDNAIHNLANLSDYRAFQTTFMSNYYYISGPSAPENNVWEMPPSARILHK